MTSDVTPFRTRAQLEAQANLAEFIRRCRNELTWLDDDPRFDWNAPEWPAIRWTKISVRTKRHVRAHEWLDPEFIEFAKAYYRWKNSHSPTKSHPEAPALKCLEAALTAVAGTGSIQQLSIEVFDEAAVVARAHFTAGVLYQVGRHLRDIARFVSNERLIPVDLSSWRSPFNRPSSVNRTGRLGRQEIDRKMPSEAGLNAMAELFANDPADTRTRFASAAWALLMPAPWRVGEMLKLHVDAEYEGEDDAGAISYGFRFYGSKGFGHDIKWVSKTMEPIAREAFRRIKEMTQPARDLARHLETAPDIPFLYPDAPPAGIDDELSLEEKATYLRRPIPKNWRDTKPTWSFKSIREHWEQVKARQPKSFPVFAKATGLKWSEALFCMHASSLHARLPTDWYRLAAPTANTLNDLLRPSGNKSGVLRELRYTEPDGTPIRLTTHQARHYQSTVAERGGMSQYDLAKWAGRARLKDNRVYNHMGEDEKVERGRALFQQIRFFGATDYVQVNPPVTLQDFNLREPGPIHHTEFGYCLHDWTMSPCDKYRDCLNCTEQVCVKGDAERYARIKARVEQVQACCDTARKEMERGTAGADRWLEYNLKTLARGRELVALLESDDVEDGALIKLNDAAEHSHLGRVLDQQLPTPRKSALSEKFQGLLREYAGG